MDGCRETVRTVKKMIPSLLRFDITSEVSR